MALEKTLRDYEKALNRLKEAYKKALTSRGTEEYEFFRDSAIQRFEFSVELMWKLIKRFLETYEGLTCRSPKSCIREFFSAGYLSEEETLKLLQMVDDRNRTSHTYHEEVAQELFQNLRGYLPLMERLLLLIGNRLKGSY